MNSVLVNRILSKLTLKELYDEINKNDKIIYALAISVFAYKKDVACKMFRNFVEKLISDNNDTDMVRFLKEKIINFDADEDFSINEISKKKVEKQETTSYEPDPCSRGFSYSNNRC